MIRSSNRSDGRTLRSLRRGGRILAAAAGIGTVLVAVSGCYKPLFPPETPRTQFETYDRMRSRYVPLEEPDVFGSPQPALRARLSRQE
jgi:hypothetical protein